MHVLTSLLAVVLVGIAAGTAAFTIAKTTITAPLRAAVSRRSSWGSKLIGCPYCLSHWLAAVGVLVTRPRPLSLWVVWDFGLSWLCAVFVAALTFGLIVRQINALLPVAPPSPTPPPVPPRPSIPTQR